MSSKSLVDLLRKVYEVKREIRKRVTLDQVIDLERKETKIEAELQKRNYLNKKEMMDYILFKKRMQRRSK